MHLPMKKDHWNSGHELLLGCKDRTLVRVFSGIIFLEKLSSLMGHRGRKFQHRFPLASKYISGRHNVLNRKHRPICQQLIKYSYYTSSTRNWKGSPSSVCIKKLIIRKKKNSSYSYKTKFNKDLG